jgi:molybdopterin/thiamine biosynthesis adenylyltransferase
MNEKSDKPTDSDAAIPDHLERYSRQIRFPAIGIEGQQQLARSTALVIGCGALGSIICNTLVRAGVGTLRIVDRDFLELSNLQRQVLYDEHDVAANLPKVIAAAEKLKAINSNVRIEPIVSDVDASNIESFLDNVDVMVDGTDNFEIRFLINDVSVKHSIPWIYGGCLGADGQTMSILPGETACLNCLMLDGPPPPGTSPTCDAFGILAPIINVIASLQSMEAIKILSGARAAVSRKLSVFSLWDNEMKSLDVSGLRDAVECPTCKGGHFQWLAGERGSHSAVLCGRNAVQLSFSDGADRTGRADREPISLENLEERLRSLGSVQRNRFLLKFTVDDYGLTVFPDGRAIISGTDEIAVARKLYAQYVGS